MKIVEVAGPRGSGKSLAAMGLVLQHASYLGQPDPTGRLTVFTFPSEFRVWYPEHTKSPRLFNGFRGEKVILFDLDGPMKAEDHPFLQELHQAEGSTIKVCAKGQKPIDVAKPELVVFTRLKEEAEELEVRTVWDPLDED